MFLKQFLKILFIYFLERGREREREGEKHQWGVASGWGPGLQPRHVPWLGIEPATPWFTGRHSTIESHQPGWKIVFFTHIYIYMYIHTGWGKSRFPVMTMRNTEFILVLLFTDYVLFSVPTTVNLLPHPVYIHIYFLFDFKRTF